MNKTISFCFFFVFCFLGGDLNESNRVFTLYDSDGDGVIHRSEIRDVILAAYRMGGRHQGIFPSTQMRTHPHRVAFITIKFSVTCDLSGLPSFFCQLGFHIGKERERERRADGIDRMLSTKLATNRRTKEFRHHDDVSCFSFEPTLHTSTHVIFKLMAVRADVNQVY